jgi:hypothetical protein
MLGRISSLLHHRAALVLISAAGLFGCGPAHGREPLPDWSAGYDKIKPQPGESAVIAGVVQFGRHSDLPANAGMAVVINDQVTWPMRIRQRDTADTPCQVHGTMDGQTHSIQCVIDTDELDLYALGLKFDLVVPEGECDFVLTSWYRYAAFECGQGPTDVSWTVNADGSTSNEKNARHGAPLCSYDYTKQDGPNGCLGVYTQVVTDAATGKTTTTEHKWGGNLCDCYDGAAWRDVDRQLDKSGCAADLYTYIGRRPLLKVVKFRGLSADYDTNVVLANYYRPSEHMGDPNTDPMPAALNPKKNPMAQPFYEISCEDDAKEEISHISIAVREWNEEVEFDADGDPDTDGIEAGWMTPIDDVPDWDVLTPDNTSYPHISRPD